MIRSFKNKDLAELFRTGTTKRIDPRMQKRIRARLNWLNVVEKPDDMNLTGFNFHALRGFNPTRYTVHVNGPWCITFEFDGKDAVKVDFEQYH